MAAISFSGLGSGIDIESIVSALVSVESTGMSKANSRIATTKAAVSDLSSVGSLLSDLKSVVDSLDTAAELSGFSGISGNENALKITTTGSARAGTYDVQVVSLLKEQRNYSATYATSDTALGESGTLRFTQGGTDYDVAIEATDSLANIASKINASGAKLKANVFYDGSNYRLQVSSSEGGSHAAFTAADVGGSLSLGLDAPESRKQIAADAEVLIDGISVKSKTNVISGAIEGVSFTLKDETASSFKVQIASDPTKMVESLNDFVKKYNAVINKIHTLAGFGSTKGTSSELAGDAALRSITGGLSSKILTKVGADGELGTLAELGIRLNNNGTLKLDETKLKDKLAENPAGFVKALAGDQSSDGLMDLMGQMLKGFTESGTGLIATRQSSFDARIKALQITATREQSRLDRLQTRLRATFANMDTAVSNAQSQLSYFYSLG